MGTLKSMRKICKLSLLENETFSERIVRPEGHLAARGNLEIVEFYREKADSGYV